MALSHFDAQGQAHMVDVSDKEVDGAGGRGRRLGEDAPGNP
jgi:molybdenum cofactor biosynthesis enzyme